MSRRRGSKRERAAAPKEQERSLEIRGDLAAREKYFEPFIIVVLLALGVYHSILYFGHQVVPNSDFLSFTSVARELLSFRLPSSYKRAPVLGVLQVILSYFVGGRHPELTAGWLLNAILHPLNAVLLWLVGKRVVGRLAVWVVIVAIINPWVIQMLADPIVETTLLFFVLLTFYFIFRGSSWCYLLASITTMVRYEGAALILAAFLMDVINHKDNGKRIRALVYAAAASVPLGLWMVGTLLSRQHMGEMHYLKVFGLPGAGNLAWLEFANSMWQVSIEPFVTPIKATCGNTSGSIIGFCKVISACSFIFGAIYGLLRRQQYVLGLLIFFLPYVFLHSVFSFVLHRFSIPVFWILMLICVYGLHICWRLVDKDERIPKPIIFATQGVLLVLCFVWLISLVPYLSEIAPISRRSVSMPYVAIGVAAAVFGGMRFVYRMRHSFRDLSIFVLVCLMIVSNQFLLVRMVGDGRRDVEFKLLADWYIANAKPGEKMLTTMVGTVRIFAPERSEFLIHPENIKAESPDDFVRKCLDNNITYVTWDSRIGLSVEDRYYKLWGIKNIVALAKPQTTGPYGFVEQILVSKTRFINIFRLKH